MGAPTLAKNGGILRISDASLDGFCTTRLYHPSIWKRSSKELCGAGCRAVLGRAQHVDAGRKDGRERWPLVAAPLAARCNKRIVRRLGEPEPLTAAETDEGYALCDSEDYREGLRAFLAREKPAFRGR